MSGTIIVMTFEDVRLAEKVLTVLDSMKSDELFKLSDAVVLVKDREGRLQIDETREITAEKGALTGGIAGLVIGTMLGGPLGGVLLGAAGGALAGRTIDLGIPDAKIRQVSQAMAIATSAILIELKSGDPQKLIGAMEESGGELFELSLSAEAQMQIQQHAADSTGDPAREDDLGI
jgi:uncharacterized membrane protein